MQKCVNILIPKLLPTILPLLCALQLEDSEGTCPLQRPSFMAVYLLQLQDFNMVPCMAPLVNGARLTGVIRGSKLLEWQAHRQ